MQRIINIILWTNLADTKGEVLQIYLWQI